MSTALWNEIFATYGYFIDDTNVLNALTRGRYMLTSSGSSHNITRYAGTSTRVVSKLDHMFVIIVLKSYGI